MIAAAFRYFALLAACAALPAAAQTARVYVTNSAGDSLHVIDPATRKVVQEIPGIEAAHGIDFSPDGRRVYVSNESDSTLDVIDREVQDRVRGRREVRLRVDERRPVAGQVQRQEPVGLRDLEPEGLAVELPGSPDVVDGEAADRLGAREHPSLLP